MRQVHRMLLGVIIAAAIAAPATAATLRIGYQKYGTLVLEKARGTLERALASRGMRVTWTEFLGGPALTEAMGAGSIDVGIAGDTPPIFAQAAGVDLAYVGVEPASPHGLAVIVPTASPVHTMHDLTGKKVTLNKGSNVHNLLVQALAANGMSVADVRPVYLKPSDGRAAYENGSVDAWVIWDPYYAAAVTAVPSRVVADGEIGGRVVDENREFFLASRPWARANPDILKAWLADLARTEAYGATHREEMAQLLAPAMGMDIQAVRLAVGRLAFGLQPITPDILATQQRIADTFATLSLIPRTVQIRQATIDNPS